MSDTDPASTLAEALGRMTWRLEEGRFALVGRAAPPEAGDLEHLTGPSQLVVEGGETTLLVAEAAVPALLTRHPDSRVEGGLAWIRFEADMGWEVVGFLALVTSRLADAGVPLGAVCGFSRDHLFVAERWLPRVHGVLSELFPGGGGR